MGQTAPPRFVSFLASSAAAWATLALLGGARAEGYFQVRGFAPAPSPTSAFTVDASYRFGLPDGQLEFRLAGVSTDRQSASVTYNRGTLFALVQLDRSATLLSSQSLLLGLAQYAFGEESPVLKSLGVTVTNVGGTGEGYAFSAWSGDVNAAGRFGEALSWTATAGAGLTDAGASATTDLRGRAELKYEATPALRFGAGVGFSRGRTEGPGFDPIETDRTFAVLNAGWDATEFEKLGASAQLDLGGGPSLGVTADSSRFAPWTLSGSANLAPEAGSYTLSATRTPDPLGVRVALSGSGGAAPTQSLDAEAQYQQGTLGVQVGGGLTAAPNDGFRITASRVGIGANVKEGPLSAQARLSASFGARPSGSLNGRLSYDAEPLRIDVGATLSLQDALTGEVDAQVLYALSPALSLNGSARYRPGTRSPFQFGFGLRYTF